MFSSDPWKQQEGEWVLVMLDFPAFKKQRPKDKVALMDKYEIEGFPTLLMLAPDGTVKGTMVGGDEEHPERYIRELKEMRDAEPEPEDDEGEADDE